MARNKKQHLELILSVRAGWTMADKVLAERLAKVRADIDTLDAQIDNEGTTVATAAGTRKANPRISIRDRAIKTEAQLTKRLKLGNERTAGGRSETVEKRNRTALDIVGRLNDADRAYDLVDLIPNYLLCAAAAGVVADDLTIPAIREQFQRECAGDDAQMDIERIREAMRQ
jgi:hypothetical protein